MAVVFLLTNSLQQGSYTRKNMYFCVWCQGAARANSSPRNGETWGSPRDQLGRVFPSQVPPHCSQWGWWTDRGAAGHSPLPRALGCSMGMSWGQAGMSVYRWGSGSGPVRGTRVKHSPVITRSTGRSWGVIQVRLFRALKADWSPQGPEVWCSLSIYQFRFCQCQVHVATTIEAMPSVGSWICIPPDASLSLWTLCSVLGLS